MKIDRYIKENNLQKVMLKTMITLWNYVYYKEDKAESEKQNYKINSYLHFHYMITHFDFKLSSIVINRYFINKIVSLFFELSKWRHRGALQSDGLTLPFQVL